MKRSVLIFLIFVFSAQAQTVFISPEVDFEKRVITLHLTPDLLEPTTISDCWVVKHKEKLYPLQAKTTVKPTQVVETARLQVLLPKSITSFKSLHETQLKCFAGLNKVSNWVFPKTELANALPNNWKILNNKLIIPNGSTVISQSLDVLADTITALPGASLRLARGVSLRLKAKSVDLKGLEILPSSANPNWGSVIIESSGPLKIEDLTSHGGSGSYFVNRSYDCSLCLNSPQVILKKVSAGYSLADSALLIAKADVTAEKLELFNNNNNALQLIDVTFKISRSVFKENKKTHLLLFRSKGQLSEGQFTQSQSEAVAVNNHSQLSIANSNISQATYALFANNSSTINGINLLLKNTDIGLGAYRKQPWWEGSQISIKQSRFEEIKLTSDFDSYSGVVHATN